MEGISNDNLEFQYPSGYILKLVPSLKATCRWFIFLDRTFAIPKWNFCLHITWRTLSFQILDFIRIVPQSSLQRGFFQIDANERALSANQIDTLLISANQRLGSKHQFENPPEWSESEHWASFWKLYVDKDNCKPFLYLNFQCLFKHYKCITGVVVQKQHNGPCAGEERLTDKDFFNGPLVKDRLSHHSFIPHNEFHEFHIIFGQSFLWMLLNRTQTLLNWGILEILNFQQVLSFSVPISDIYHKAFIQWFPIIFNDNNF